MTKQEILDFIQTLPDTAEYEDIQYSLYVKQQVEIGRQQAREGKGIPSKEMFKLFGLEWSE